MKLYLIRHGQSEANLHKMHAGWGQFPLTEKGREDALRAGKILEGLTFDKIYSSDLIRAIETQQLAYPSDSVERNPLIREINAGKLVGRLFAECLEEYGEPYANHRRIFDYSAYGGESYDELCARIRAFLDILEQSPYENVAAFCHGGIITTLLDVITGKRHERRQFVCENGSVSVFEYKDGKWKLRLWNYTGIV